MSPTAPGPGVGDPVEVIRVELDRVDRRWHDLSLDHAVAASPRLLTAASTLAGGQLSPVPPAAAVDQLRASAFDAVRVATMGATRAADSRGGLLGHAEIAQILTAVRRSLP